jgi:hypothetical protein
MPVTTRNQLKNIISYENSSALQEVKKPLSITKVSSGKNNILSWFISVTIKGLVDIDTNTKKIHLLKKLITQNPDIKNINDYKREIRTIYYSSLRHITEILYLVEKYYPEVHNLSDGMIRFSKVVYNKVQELYGQIRSSSSSSYKPETEDEKKSIVALISTLQDVEKMIIPYLPSDEPIKRRRNFVDYTGMDTIETDEYCDRIDDIWYERMVYDSDYIPEEDEDEDDFDADFDDFHDDVEDFVEPEEDEHDYSESEDYIQENEELDCYEDDGVFEIFVK